MRRPNSRRHLDAAIERIAGRGRPYVEARTVLADAIVGQLLPNGVVKGGSALKLRFGDAATRFTRDLDTARCSGLNEYIDDLKGSLKRGWQGFGGTVVAKPPAHIDEIPEAYVMQPFNIKLSYLGKSWVTVPFEVGYNEIGDADCADLVVPVDANRLLLELGFPQLGPISVMRLTHQIAQKLHALTAVGSKRVHDLVDLQLILSRETVNFEELRRVCRRLFAYRQRQVWPPAVQKGIGWEAMYVVISEGLDVAVDLDEAISWMNNIINQIENAGRS